MRRSECECPWAANGAITRQVSADDRWALRSRRTAQLASQPGHDWPGSVMGPRVGFVAPWHNGSNHEENRSPPLDSAQKVL